MDSNEKMLSVKEVAGVLGVSRDSVVRLVRRGHLKCVVFPQMGGHGRNPGRRFREGEVRRFLRVNEQ
jgi:excisionase family DNA binding protein